MTGGPPVRYDEEGKSFAPRRPEGELSTSVEKLPGEPEKLVIPAIAVEQLLNWALRQESGNAWWAGFVTAHGIPSWIESGEWRFAGQSVEVVKAPRPAQPGTAVLNGSHPGAR